MKNGAWLVAAGVMVASCAGTTANVARSLETPAVARPGVAHLAGAGDPLSVDVYPHVVGNDGNAWVRLRIEPDPRAVSVDLEWWSLDGVGGAHLINLEGDLAAVRHQYGLKNLDPGEYEIIAVLTRSDGTHVRRSTNLIVVGTR
jgi:hypothetical protein